MAERPYRDKDWLQEQWHKAESVPEIADKCGVSPSTITTWARKHDLPHFNNARPYNDPDTLRELYHEEGMSLEEIGDELGCTNGWVGQKMEEFGIERRSISEAKQKKNPAVQYYTHPQGYVYVASEHNGKADKTAVHQLIAIAEGADPKKIFDGRKTVVHHKDGIKWNNHAKNLEVMSSSEHAKMHYESGETDPQVNN